MADPRDELAYADMANEPGLVPPREPLRIRVSPYDTPPPSETGWGGFGAGGRPTGRLFEPDQEPAVPEQPPWQGGRLLEPDQTPVPQKPAFQPGILSLGNVVRGIGSLVQGAGDSFGAPAQATTGDNTRQVATRDPTAGPRQMWQQGYPSAPYSSMFKGPAEAVGHVATEVLQEPYNLVRAGQDVRAPGATDQQVQQAREQEAGAATNLTSNLLGMNAPFAAARPGTAGVFGGRLAKGFDPNKEKLAELMHQNGVPAPQIWKETGMVKFADGKWAHEIPDIAASYKGNVDQIASKIFDQQNPKRAGQYGSDTNVLRSQIARQDALLKMQGKAQLYLEDVIDHPELFNAYPELRKMPVSHDAFMHASGGYLPRSQFDPEAKIFYREEGHASQMARGKTFDTLLHEIQHAIQQIEGMAKGSNPAKDLALTPGTPANAIYLDMISQIPPGLSASRKKELSNAFAIQAGGQAYSRSAGENVANITAVRKDLTPEQAAAFFPPGQFRTPMSEQVVEFNKHTGFPPEQLPLLSDQQSQMGGVLNPVPREMQMSAGSVLRGKAADEAWRGIEKEPKLRTSVHPYSNVGGTPIREMESPIIKGAPKAPPRLLDVEKDLANAELIFTGGDATGAGGKLYGSKSMPFETPVPRHGGPGYAQNMQGKKIEGAPGASPVWASMKGPMGEIYNIASDVERRGKVPWQVYMTGGKQYLDSSMQMVDTVVQAAKAKGVSTTANEHLVKVMQSDWNTAANAKLPFPETGFKDEAALKAWIDASPQPQRAKFVKAMDTKTARELGFPDIGQLRVWNTDTRMLTAPPGSAGLSMARIDPSVGLIPSHHPSYSTAVGGIDVGTLGMQVPHQIIAPTMHESRMATLAKPQYYEAAPHLYFPGGGSKATKTEPVTNKLKDILQRWMLDSPGGLAVAGTAGGIGSLVDLKGYQPEAR